MLKGKTMQSLLKKINGKLKVPKAMKEITSLRKLKMQKCWSRLSHKLKSIKLRGIWQLPRKERLTRNDAHKLKFKSNRRPKMNVVSKFKRKRRLKRKKRRLRRKKRRLKRKERRLKRKINAKHFLRKELANKANNQRMIPLRPRRRRLKRPWVKNNRKKFQKMTIQS